MKTTFAQFREASRQLQEEKPRTIILWQFRFVAPTWDGDQEGRLWAVVDEEEVIQAMRRDIKPTGYIMIDKVKIRVDYHPEERPLLVIHTVS